VKRDLRGCDSIPCFVAAFKSGQREGMCDFRAFREVVNDIEPVIGDDDPVFFMLGLEFIGRMDRELRWKQVQIDERGWLYVKGECHLLELPQSLCDG
jgi:hypothetical protein